jgi:hypothetical protein
VGTSAARLGLPARPAVRVARAVRAVMRVAQHAAPAKAVRGARPGRPCGIRRRVGAGRGRIRRGKRVHLVAPTAVHVRAGRKSVRLVARSAKVLTVVGPHVLTGRKSLASRRTEISKHRPRAGAEVRPPNIRTECLRPNNWTMQLRVKSMTVMSSRAVAAGVGVRRVAKQGSEFRRSSLALVLDHAARSRSGFAPGESPSTVSLRFSGCALDRPITSGSTAD